MCEKDMNSLKKEIKIVFGNEKVVFEDLKNQKGFMAFSSVKHNKNSAKEMGIY